ncbi:MAG: hypothetical protein AUJ92_02170 [Armatimonadetes bacterium CG2_30_59_28]|nr:nicotinamide-nucleotide amidohydrolase family protein [Armatimonadota bacterium]OIO98056.1 MAG: hypothetical protein AUJ92_02170 [Armatimonadetes bacterium CG2_30_59_28]PIU67362.1 MAG: hypothetical protein COS85_00865 [Armatimonadetes bacterium CG07_land_8_20_14_0_80_59_28]PIX40601.1 MAG: hypothetical protein COZ56_14310 [Armatimonadetes bacterium CG_4_8_14_3_um_filter_58_9]
MENRLLEEVARELTGRGWTISTAESCTGGAVGYRLTSLAGSSHYYVGGVIAYSNAIKTALLGVPESLLEAHGAVSAPCATSMAEGCRKLFGADMAVSVTGIAGPGGGTVPKPVGLVYIGVAHDVVASVREFRFNGDRERVRRSAAHSALKMILNSLNGV